LPASDGVAIKRNFMPPLRAVALVAVAIAAFGFAAPSAPAARPDQLGIAAGGHLHNLKGKSLARELNGYRRAGARWIRFDVNWSVVQHRGPRSYNWAPFDRVIRGARARGIAVLGMIAYTPRWARSGSHDLNPPRNAAAYAKFAAAVARRYAPLGVHHWEIWNEPNMAFFWRPRPRPAAYTRLLQAAYVAIKGADPGAFVVSGGLAPSAGEGSNIPPIAFLRSMYANGARGYFDALGHHPSTFPYLPSVRQPWSPWFQMFGTNPNLLSVMVTHGDVGKSIWLTEYGAPTRGRRSVSERRQAQILTSAYRLVGAYPWAGPLFWYSFRDRRASGNWWDFCGLVRQNYSRKPAFRAYRRAAGLG
jgi:hypothetical protein